MILAASALILLLITWIFAHWDLDRSISARFYDPDQGWFLEKAPPWFWLYRYGTIPGLLLILASLAGFVINRVRRPDSDWHRYCLLIFLTAVLGAGLLVNGFLKPYWGRPRPTQIQAFGGQYTYRHALRPGIPGKGKSFTCGHCTMGFLFVALVYCRRRSKTLAWVGGLGGMAYGGLVSAARVVQGAHFVTDCIWSLGALWLVATLLYYYILKIPSPVDTPKRSLPSKQKRLVIIFATLVAAAIVLAFLTRRPFFETGYFYPQLPDNISEIHIGLDPDATKRTVRYSDRAPLQILIHARGFAWTGASDTKTVRSATTADTTYHVIYETETQGYFSELTYEIEVVIPSHRKNQMAVVFTDANGRQHSPGE
jgi:membrane-associated PAP2 superfamily phosphatase